MKNIQCLNFDFGNVIAFFDHRKACRQLAKISNGNFSENQVYAEIFKPGGLEEKYDRGMISTDKFISQLKEQFQLDASQKEIENAWSDIFWPNKDVINLIPILRRMSYQLILASNTNELHYNWYRVKFASVLQNFHGRVLSHIEKCRKPDTEFFQKCIEQSKCLPSECVFIDDREDYVNVACDLGMRGVTYVSIADLIQRLEDFGIVIRNS